ncbi:hypothetical protein HF521_008877 [Silurus meridionalis]|uniref:Uncharacterized protein n=1 Tax=Silurus meridionalis TaxID=175797 RepID=A0A8T0BT18_SILME|nr:hypothetical protein HF521_008877 [Silurus meridionalis]
MLYIFRAGTGVGQTILVFNSSAPIPTETLVLLSSQLTSISDLIQVTNFTSEKISNTSYAVIFTFSLSNISMTETPDLSNNTETKLQRSINKVLKTLLSAPGAELLTPKSFNYTTGSAMVQARVVFNPFTPVPSESLALSAITSLLSSRFTNLTGTLKVLNVTYQRISNTSYALIFNISISNISISENREIENNTYTQVENAINNALNTLLNAPNADPFTPKSSNYTTGSAMVQARVVFNSFTPVPRISNTSYALIFNISISNISISENREIENNTYSQVENAINNALNTLLNAPNADPFTPKSSNYTTGSAMVQARVVFNSFTPVPRISNTSYALIFNISISNISISENREIENTYSQVENAINNALNTLLNAPNADPFTPKSSNYTTGSAMVQARVVFNSFTPVPSESLALSAITSLLSSRFTNLTDTLKVLNVTYHRISNTSYALIFNISISNISISENREIENTYSQVENAINNALNTLLNAPNADPFTPKSSNYTTGSAMVQARVVFNSFTPVPSESLALSAITSLLSSRFTNLTDTLKVLNVTYHRISNTSYALIFNISISNISISENREIENNTYSQVENAINNALNTLLNAPNADPFTPKSSNYTLSGKQIGGEIEYSFQNGDTKNPVNYLSELQKQSGETGPRTEPADPQSSSGRKSPRGRMGTVLIYIRLVFKNLTNVPSQADVIKAANALLDSSVRLARDTETVKVFNPVSIQDVTYQKLGNNSYIIGFGFAIMNVSIALNTDLRNDTYDLIQNTINGLLNRILNSPNSKPFIFPRANYMGNSTMIVADSEYVFSQGGSDGLRFEPSGFLAQILIVSGLSDPPSPTLAPITIVTEFLPISVEGGLPEWALAIIIPCTVAIILIPCWILICCLLCGCCAALRRRYSRRRSYNVQYTTRNGLF